MTPGLTVLVDSNIYIGLLRRHCDPAAELGAWIGEGNIATCGIVRVEVERGLKFEKIRRRMAAFFDLMIAVPTSNQVWQATTDLAWKLDRMGRKLPTQDILIAVSAMKSDGVVLSDDAHFRWIPGLKVLLPGDELPAW